MPSKKLIAFNYFGGKYLFLDWIIPKLYPSQHYVEPFCGSAVVFLNKYPSDIETINDINSEVCNFFEVLREKKDELISLLQLTPYSREEYMRCKALSDNRVEKARRFFVRIKQSYGGLGASGSRASAWRITKGTSRRGISGEVSKWLSAIDGLPEVAARLKQAHIENLHAFDIIEKYDSPETTLYVDPPYPHSSRSEKVSYAYEMKDEEHHQLGELLNSAKSKIAISTYENKIYDEIYKDWVKIKSEVKSISVGKSPVQETLYLNYDPSVITNFSLFQEGSYGTR